MSPAATAFQGSGRGEKTVLRSLNELENFTLIATDGEIGAVVGFLIDDASWTLRYLIAETNGPSGARDALISPISFRRADWETRCIHLALTREMVRRSPDIDTDQPVTRGQEIEYHRFLGYSRYWGGTNLWGAGTNPALLAIEGWDDAVAGAGERPGDQADDRRLHSVAGIRGFHVRGREAEIGLSADLVVDEVTWEVRYLAVATGDWWPGGKVLLAPRWARQVGWEERTVHFDLSRDAVRDSPSWDGACPVDRRYELRLNDHYGRGVNRGSTDLPADPAPPPRAGRRRARFRRDSS